MNTMFMNDSESISSATGFACLFVLCIAFGTTYWPIKAYNMGNGIFFQWIMCISISVTGLLVHIAIGSPRIIPLTVLSGILFSSGNILAVPTIKRLGMGLGVLIWSIVNLIFGWASSRFGWFGIQPEVPSNIWMNYSGVALSGCSAILYIFMKPNASNESIEQIVVANNSELEPLLSDTTAQNNSSDNITPIQQISIQTRSSDIRSRIEGVCFSIISGLCYSQVFIPTIYIQENMTGASQRGIDYIGATSVGVLLTSTAFFCLYASYTGNKPELLPAHTILPAMLTGFLWCIGQMCWLVANQVLQASITFPIAATGPGAIATIIGVVFYREVKGLRNWIILILALSTTVAGVFLTALSK